MITSEFLGLPMIRDRDEYSYRCFTTGLLLDWARGGALKSGKERGIGRAEKGSLLMVGSLFIIPETAPWMRGAARGVWGEVKPLDEG